MREVRFKIDEFVQRLGYDSERVKEHAWKIVEDVAKYNDFIELDKERGEVVIRLREPEYIYVKVDVNEFVRQVAGKELGRLEKIDLFARLSALNGYILYDGRTDTLFIKVRVR